MFNLFKISIIFLWAASSPLFHCIMSVTGFPPIFYLREKIKKEKKKNREREKEEKKKTEPRNPE